MLEPSPRHIPAPQSEPEIKVGLVLQEDRITNQQIHAHENYQILADLTLARGKSAEIFLTNQNSLGLSIESAINPNLNNLPCIELIPEGDKVLSPQSGLEIQPVIAGRNFHWRKDIKASYPGKLSFTANNGSIRLINTVSFEDYLSCVLTSEMSADCPHEFMKAQIVCARSWAYVFLREKHPDSGFDVCNDDDCQRYQGTTFLNPAALQAARSTRGEFLLYQQTGQPDYVVPAYYAKTCGGYSEDPREIFGFEEPSLVRIADQESSQSSTTLLADKYINIAPHNAEQFYCGQTERVKMSDYLGKVDQGGAHFRWACSFSQEELIKNIQEKCSLPELRQILRIKILSRSSGFRVTKLEIGYETSSHKTKTLILDSQYKIREALSPSFLPSSAFNISVDDSGTYYLSGAGWGHGVGLCQVGGVMMALAGKSYKEILRHYFPRAELIRTY